MISLRNLKIMGLMTIPPFTEEWGSGHALFSSDYAEFGIIC